MPFPDATGWVPDQQLNGIGGAQPPQYVLDQMGGSFDSSKYYWNPDTFSLVDRYTGGSYGFDRADHAMGTNVVVGGQTTNFAQGEQPFIGFPGGGGYNAGRFPNSGTFVSSDPNEIADYESANRDRNIQGLARVGAVVGGAAALGATPWGQAGGAAATGSPAYTGATTAAGLPTGSAAAAGGGVGALSGAVPAVGASPGLAAGLGAAGSGVLDSSGSVIPGTEPTNALGGAGGALSGMPDWVGNYLLSGLNGLIGANAANQASDAMAGAADRAIEENRRQYDTSRNDLMPWLDAGRGALGRLQDPNSFTAFPGYEWARNEGQRDIGNSFAALGGAASGNALRALSEFNTGLAAQDYNNWWNREAGLAGVGQNTAVNLGSLGANSAANAGNYLTNQGEARASGVLGRTNAIQNALYYGYRNYRNR